MPIPSRRTARGAILVALCALLLLFGSYACGGSGADSGSPSGSPGGEPDPTNWSFQTQVSPSAVDVLVSVGDGVTVLLPQGLLQEARVLSVSPIANPRPHSLPFLTIGAAYSVDLGKLHDLGDQEVVVSIPYTPVDSEDPTVSYFGAYYDETIGDWVTLPTSIDTVNRRLFIHTRHLSDVGVGKFMDTWGNFDFLQNEQFTLLYYKDEARRETSWPNGWARDDDAPHIPLVNRAISDVWFQLNRAYQIYTKPPNEFKDLLYGKTRELGFNAHGRVDWTETVWFGQKVYVTGNGSSNRNKVTHNITLGYTWVSSKVFRSTVAHELFHSFQARSYNAVTMTTGTWWMEATAEMAQGRLIFPDENVFGQPFAMGNDSAEDRKFWIQQPLDFFFGAVVDPLLRDRKHRNHQDETSHFLAYLADYKGVDFVDLYKKQTEYRTGSFLSNLAYYLKTTKNLSLEDVYQDYSEFFVFDANSPVRSYLLGDGLLQLSENADKEQPLLASEKTRTWQAWLAGEYSGKLYRIPIEEAPTPRRLKLRLASPDDWNVSVRAYGANAGLVDRSKRLGVLTPAASELTFQHRPGDVVYFLVTAGRAPSDGLPRATVEIAEQPQTEVTIFDIVNPSWVTQRPGGPPSLTSFTLNDTYLITEVGTYHWNEGAGPAVPPGTIGLLLGTTLYGPWQVTIRPGMYGTPTFWVAQPNVILGPGTYTVVDSDPATWSYNSYSQDRGFAWVLGIKQ